MVRLSSFWTKIWIHSTQTQFLKMEG
jgi:hypothetical protein